MHLSGDTVKKEISALAGLLIDLNMDERPRVKTIFQDLNAHDDRLRALAKRPYSFQLEQKLILSRDGQEFGVDPKGFAIMWPRIICLIIIMIARTAVTLVMVG